MAYCQSRVDDRKVDGRKRLEHLKKGHDHSMNEINTRQSRRV